MGHNTDIKRYNAKPEGQPVDLFDSVRGRLPVVLELLKSPWIVRGSELVCDTDTPGAKRTAEEVPVAWDGGKRAPAAFTWKGRRYRIDALVQTWAVERWWWDRERRVSRRCFRVLSRGGVYDLAFDRLQARWLLVGVAD